MKHYVSPDEIETKLSQQVAEIIKERREQLGLSQETLAALAGKSGSGRAWICRIEAHDMGSGDKGLGLKSLARLFAALKIKIAFEYEDLEAEEQTYRKNY